MGVTRSARSKTYWLHCLLHFLIRMKFDVVMGLLSSFTFHLGFVHPLQDVALHQYLPLSSVAFLFRAVPSFLEMSSCLLLLDRPLDLFPLFSCHCVPRLVHLLSFSLTICPVHLHFCFSVYTIMPIIFVLFLISEHGILSCSFRFNIFISIALFKAINLDDLCLHSRSQLYEK